MRHTPYRNHSPRNVSKDRSHVPMIPRSPVRARAFRHWPGLPALDRIPRRFGRVLPAGRGDPPERPVGQLLHLPLGVLLEAMVVTALRAGVAQARPSACLIGSVVVLVL